MAVNNPFIRYKIYSTSTPAAIESFRLGAGVEVICLIPEEHQALQPFLEKILSAARIAQQDYQIITLREDDRPLISDHDEFQNIRYVLLFGIKAASVGIQIRHRLYECDTVRNSKFIQLPTLPRIESDKNEKQKLWNLLKKEFLDE